MFDRMSLSIILQGNITHSTKKILIHLKTIFPQSEIILSTYKGSSLTDLIYDKVVLIDDPGGTIVDEVSGTMNNVNRQLATTQAGLALVTRPYVLKTRTDIFIHDGSFLDFFDKFNDIPSEIFEKRLLICNYFTRNPRIFPLCFHPSDWMVFGCTEDVKKYYDIPFQTEEDANWFRNHPKTSPIFVNHIGRYTPEQHIFISFLKQHRDFHCDSYHHHSPELVQLTEWAFANCFIVLDYQKQIHIDFVKYDPNRYKEQYTLLHHWQWKGLWEKYCLKKPSFLYYLYVLHGVFYKIQYVLRVFLIKILETLKLKEFVKQILQRRKGES